MVGMEVNAGEPFDTENHTVVQLVTWLQSQDQNSQVKLEGGGRLVFRKLRNHAGGGIQVEVTHDEQPRRAKSKTERLLEKAQVSRTDSPAEAQALVDDGKQQTGPGGRTKADDVLADNKKAQDKQVKENEDTILGVNDGEDQGGVVPGTTKTPSDKSSKNTK